MTALVVAVGRRGRRGREEGGGGRGEICTPRMEYNTPRSIGVLEYWSIRLPGTSWSMEYWPRLAAWEYWSME